MPGNRAWLFFDHLSSAKIEKNYKTLSDMHMHGVFNDNENRKFEIGLGYSLEVIM